MLEFAKFIDHILVECETYRFYCFSEVASSELNDHTTPPFPMTDEQVYVYLDHALANMIQRRDVDLAPGERGRLYGWYWGYYGRAAIDMYRVSQDTRYIEIVERTIEALLEERDDQLLRVDDERGVIVPGWGTKYSSGTRSNEITTAGLITLPMLEYANLSGKSWIRDAAVETLISFQDERIEVSGGCYYFMHQTQNIVEALNHSALYGAALAKASCIHDDPWFKDTALGLYRYFVKFIDQRGNGISWPYSPAPGDDRKALSSEALWKAAATIELPIALSENEEEEATVLLENVARSLLSHPAVEGGELPQFIGHDRPQAVDSEKVSGGLTGFLSAFLQIDDDELRSRIFSLMKSHPHMFPNGWKGGSRSMIMAWSHMRSRGHV